MIQDMIRIGRIAVIFSILVSCSIDTSELKGIYIARNFTESIDTLKLKDNGIYYRSIYDKKKNKLIFKGNAKWEYKNGEIVLNGFLSNMDELKYYNESVEYDNVLSTSFLIVEKDIFEGVKIIIHKDLKYFYKKTPPLAPE